MEDSNTENGAIGEGQDPRNGDFQDSDKAYHESENGDRSAKTEMEDRNGYEGYEPYQDSYYRKRYDEKRLTLRDKQDHLKAKNLIVYLNGSVTGFKVVYSRKRCATLDRVYDEVAANPKARQAKIRVDRLYKWPSGSMVTCLADIEEEEEGLLVFVCSDKKSKLQTYIRYHDMDYGGCGGNRSSRDTFRSQKPSPTSVRSNRSSVRPAYARPITIRVISNTHRHSNQSVLFNPNRPFEELLKDITDMLEMENPPCISLHPVKNTREKIESNSTFKKIITTYKGTDQFYAVGREGMVLSPSPRGISPNNGHGKQSHRSKNGMRQNGYHNGQMTNGYDRQNENDDYEDSAGRTYRRQVDDGRSRPDGDDEEGMYTQRSDKPDRRRRDSPGKQSQTQTNQRRVDDRRRDESYDRRDNNVKGRQSQDYRRDENDDRRHNGYDKRVVNSYRNDRGRNDRDRDESEERGRKDTQRDNNARGHRDERDDSDYENKRRQDTKRDERGRNKGGEDTRGRKDGRDDNDDRDYGRGRKDTTRDDMGRNDRNHDDSRGDRGRRDSVRKDRGRDDSRDRQRGYGGRRNSSGDDNDSRNSSRSNSPTDSEMGRRREEVDNIDKLSRDKSVLF